MRERGGLPTLDFAGCAIHWAEHAQTKFREAARQCKDGDIDSVDVTVGDALGALQTRYYFHSSVSSDLSFLTLSQYRNGADYILQI